MEANCNGVAIEYEDGGCGPAVLVLHDYPSSVELRGHFLPLVEAGYRVILTNLGGFDGNQNAHATAAVALLDYLGVGRAGILGISRGGEVLLELMEECPGRVAAGSLVVSDATALALRKSAGEGGMQGTLDCFRTSCLAAASTEGALSRAPAELRILPAWVERIRARLGGRKDLPSLLGAMDLPPLLVEPPCGDVLPVEGLARSWRPIRTLNGHLARLLDALLPPEEDPDEEVFSDRA